jgi:cytochrome c5
MSGQAVKHFDDIDNETEDDASQEALSSDNDQHHKQGKTAKARPRSASSASAKRCIALCDMCHRRGLHYASPQVMKHHRDTYWQDKQRKCMHVLVLGDVLCSFRSPCSSSRQRV